MNLRVARLGVIPIVATVLTSVACFGGGDRTKRAVDTTAMNAIRAESVTAATVAALPPATQWDVDHVAERLVRAGVAPRRSAETPPAPAFLAAATTAVFTVGKVGELRVFIFADSLARRRATASLDTATVAPPGTASPWPSAPLLIVSNNLAAVLLGGGSTLQERVQLALEAGLPGR